MSGRDVVELCHDILPGSLPIEPKDAAQMERIMEVAGQIFAKTLYLNLVGRFHEVGVHFVKKA